MDTFEGLIGQEGALWRLVEVILERETQATSLYEKYAIIASTPLKWERPTSTFDLMLYSFDC